MTKEQLTFLAKAGLIDSATIYRTWEFITEDNSDHTYQPAGGWRVEFIGHPNVRSCGSILETARGQHRMFKTLDTANEFLRNCGYQAAITIDEFSRPYD
jgi:hypothetical protein